MILCARSTARSSEQSKKRRSRSERMLKVCLFCSQNNKIVMIIKHGRHIFGKMYEMPKGLWAFFLDCAFRMLLIGWAGKLRSRGSNGGVHAVVEQTTWFFAIFMYKLDRKTRQWNAQRKTVVKQDIWTTYPTLRAYTATLCSSKCILSGRGQAT